MRSLLSILGIVLFLGAVAIGGFIAFNSQNLTLALVVGIQFLSGIILWVSYKWQLKALAIESFSNQISDLTVEEREAAEAKKREELRLEKLNLRTEKLLKIIHDSVNTNLEDSVLSSLANELQASQAAFFKASIEGDKRILKLKSSFAYHIPDSQEVVFEFGEGLSGQVAKDGNLINIKEIPDGYITILSGLGKSTPTNLVISPVKLDGNVVGVVEISSFNEFSADDEHLIELICNKLGEKLAV
ncbi:MAG: GAF domain-containing protein [Cytophagales bacterium]|nr:GAF domain-containing protein [Cytophagales bacterium]